MTIRLEHPIYGEVSRDLCIQCSPQKSIISPLRFRTKRMSSRVLNLVLNLVESTSLQLCTHVQRGCIDCTGREVCVTHTQLYYPNEGTAHVTLLMSRVTLLYHFKNFNFILFSRTPRYHRWDIVWLEKATKFRLKYPNSDLQDPRSGILPSNAYRHKWVFSFLAFSHLKILISTFF